MTFSTHHLEFAVTAVTRFALEERPGSALRGALVGSLWDRFCANKAAPACAPCPLVRACPVAALVAPLREDGATGGEQRPRPYVIQPPQGLRYVAPGESFTFRLALFGAVAPLFPYVVMAAQGLERAGLGRPLAANEGRRGRPRLTGISAIHPLSGARQPLYTPGVPHVQTPGLPVTASAVAAHADSLPTDRLTLTFLTPLRLIDRGKLVHSFAPRPFVQRLLERLDQLRAAYGEPGTASDSRPLLPLADQVRVLDDRTRWVDVAGYSARQGRRLPLGGLTGQVTIAGTIGPLREALVWGSLIHVGKNAVKGDGWYQVGPARYTS